MLLVIAGCAAVLAIALQPAPASATEVGTKQFGLGAILGEPTGGTGKLWFNERVALQFSLAATWWLGYHRLATFVDVVWHPLMVTDNKHFTLLWYFGVGGGFGIRAAAAGASEMLGLDRSEPALGVARASAKAAGLGRRCRFQTIDLFGGAGARGWPKGSWDLVVLDPPALCKSRGETKAALGAYDHLNRKAAGRVGPGGILLSCSCTYPVTEEVWQGTVLRALRRAGRPGRVIHRGGQGADHPVLPGMPETRYLKVLAIQLP